MKPASQVHLEGGRVTGNQRPRFTWKEGESRGNQLPRFTWKEGESRGNQLPRFTWKDGCESSVAVCVCVLYIYYSRSLNEFIAVCECKDVGGTLICLS